MIVDWSAYEPYVPPHWGPLEDMTRSAARECYEHLMAARPERQRQLAALLAANGASLSSNDEGLLALGKWFRANVEPSERTPHRLTNFWYAVTNDVGLFLGDTLIGRAPTLHWAFFAWGGKRDVSYQRHVIMGFRGDQRLRLNANFDMRVAAYGVRVIDGVVIDGVEARDDEFLQWVQGDVLRA